MQNGTAVPFQRERTNVQEQGAGTSALGAVCSCSGAIQQKRALGRGGHLLRGQHLRRIPHISRLALPT